MSAAPSFDYRVESIRTPALTLEYHLVPWDTVILGRVVAQIGAVQLHDTARAADDYRGFMDWCSRNEVALCACRLPGEQLAESMFLEERHFRFIELNYVPQLKGLQDLSYRDEGIEVLAAADRDRTTMGAMAGEVFEHGRWHQDPRIGPALGNKRYRIWLENAFSVPHQQVVKCVLDGRIVAFFVVESRDLGHVHWSLNGLAPGLQGRGLGKRVWRAMLRWHREQGVDTVTTSISSHNVRVFNLYAALGFRFPAPSMTLQWCESDRAA